MIITQSSCRRGQVFSAHCIDEEIKVQRSCLTGHRHDRSRQFYLSQKREADGLCTVQKTLSLFFLNFLLEAKTLVCESSSPEDKYFSYCSSVYVPMLLFSLLDSFSILISSPSSLKAVGKSTRYTLRTESEMGINLSRTV